MRKIIPIIPVVFCSLVESKEQLTKNDRLCEIPIRRWMFQQANPWILCDSMRACQPLRHNPEAAAGEIRLNSRTPRELQEIHMNVALAEKRRLGTRVVSTQQPVPYTIPSPA